MTFKVKLSFLNKWIENLIVILIGAGGGIGEKISLIFAETGAKVVLVDINEEGIKRVSQICKKASPHNYDVKYLL